MLELLRKPLYHGSVWSFKRVDVLKGSVLRRMMIRAC